MDINGDFQKVVWDSDTKSIVFIAEYLSDKFVDVIIEIHNDQVRNAYANGLKDGAEIKRSI